MKSSFGYFAEDGREFVVTDVNTPRALVNYFWNPVFISGISQHGGGEGVYKERAMQYIDLRDRSLLVRESHRYFYLRDEANATVWSPGWHPVQREVENFQCRHGLGYSVISSALNGIETEMRIFVPARDPCEIWTVTIGNRRDRDATLKFYSFVDWLLAGYPRYCDYFGCLSGEYWPDIFAAQGCNRAVERTHDVFDGFVASDTEPSSFDTSKRCFLGNFGQVNMPEAVLKGQCTNSEASCEKLVSVLEHTIQLAPGEDQTFNIFIGASSGYEMTRSLVTRLSAPGEVESEFAALKARKEEMVRRVRIETPDSRVNYLINGWIKQQAQVYADVGSDNGRGFRDAIQLVWATASYDAEYTRRMLIECLSHQFADGHTLRGWMPIDDHHYSDGPGWIPPAVDAYLRETGDYAFLDCIVPFFDGGVGAVWDHVLQAMRHSSDDTGAHGLILAHFGDWNDSLTGVGPGGKGETVWGTIALVYALKIAARISAKVRHNDDEADELRSRADRLTAAIDAHAWDGQWYLRAFNDEGRKIGTHTETEGRIYLLPQVWAIMAGIVDDDKAARLLAVVDEYLETDCGSKTLDPPYTHADPSIGRITNLVPGMWENGTPYCHANGFKIVADCLAGRGDKAYATFKKVMPDSETNPSTHSFCEPYVLTNQYLGPENRRAGQTLWAWMTGAGAWLFRAMTEGMIGVRGDYDGLVIDPCLPSAWKECSIERDFRGARYRVEIRNDEGLQKGRTVITVDGEKIEGNVVPIFGDGKLHVVRVELTQP